MSIAPELASVRTKSSQTLAPVGMGEVFRARDTKLNRIVALKVLPESFASDPERVARFKREAQTLASLNIRTSRRFTDSKIRRKVRRW